MLATFWTALQGIMLFYKSQCTFWCICTLEYYFLIKINRWYKPMYQMKANRNSHGKKWGKEQMRTLLLTAHFFPTAAQCSLLFFKANLNVTCRIIPFL